MSDGTRILLHKADPQMADIMRAAAKAEAFDQFWMVWEEFLSAEEALVRLRKSKASDKYTKQVEAETRVMLARGLINRMRERWRR